MQPAYPAAPPPAPKKRSVAKIIAGCLGVLVLSCCCFSGIGGYIAYLENRDLYTPGDEISRAPLQPGAPQQVAVEFPGSGYGFAQIWMELEAQQTGPELTLHGSVSCAREAGGGGYPDTVDIMVWGQNARVTDFTRSGDHVTAKVMVHDEYMREGERPKSCTVDVQPQGGVITGGSLVVRTYQRPSDRFAN